MFRISRRLDYGLQLMIALAQETDNRAQATAVLAEKLQIPGRREILGPVSGSKVGNPGTRQNDHHQPKGTSCAWE